MKRFAIILAAITACTIANAREWTLQECIDYAIENNLTVRQQELSRQSAEQQVISAKDAVLPQIDGSASQSWSFGRGLTSANTYANRNTSTFGAQIGLNMPLFNGLQTVRNVKLAKSSLVAVVEQLEASKDNIVLQVMAQYLQVLYCQELEEVAKAQAELTLDEQQRSEALLNAGKIPESDMLDAKSSAAEAQMEWVSAQNDTRLALVDLAQLLRIESIEDFEIATLPTDNLPIIREPQAVYEAALGINHTIRASELQLKVADNQISLAKSGYIPKLSFNAGLGSNYYRIGGESNESFGSQMRQNFSQYVGFSLSVPIFDGFSTRNSVRSAKIERLNADLQLETQKDNLFKAVQECYYQAIGAKEKLAAAEDAVTAAAAAMESVQEKFSLGRATSTDFDTAKNRYVQAMSERVRALYELILRARILDFYATNQR